MEIRGRLTEWNDDRGFGFITPLDGDARVFAHVSDFPHHKRRPFAMDLVTYTLGQDDRGRPRATRIDFLTPTNPVTVTPAASYKWALPVAVAVAALAIAGVSIPRLIESARPDNGSVTITNPAPAVQAPPVAAQPATVVPSADDPAVYKVPDEEAEPEDASAPVGETLSASDKTLRDAFQRRRKSLQVRGVGIVSRVLSDDNDGSRHQRFILRLDSGQTLLVAHNIDIAPRVANLAVESSVVEFYGEYEWDAQGGVIHWTHRDPAGNHTAGWLKHNGVTSQ